MTGVRSRKRWARFMPPRRRPAACATPTTRAGSWSQASTRLPGARRKPMCEASLPGWTIWRHSPECGPSVIESGPTLIGLTLWLGFAVQPIAENPQRRVLLPYRAIGQIPAFVFPPDDRKRGDEPARDQRITDIGKLRYSDTYAIEHSLDCHRRVLERHLRSRLDGRAQTHCFEPPSPLRAQMRDNDQRGAGEVSGMPQTLCDLRCANRYERCRE